MKVFVIDVARCNGCYSCQIVCKDEHVSNDWTPYAKPQPDVGQFWMKLNQKTCGTIPKVKVAFKPTLCMHCDNAPCIKSCKIKGGIYKRHDGLVVINPNLCTGCKNCVDACPYNAIYFNEDLNLAQKCTGCAHLIDRGWKAPRCADACPTEAIKFGEESDFEELIKKAEIMLPEAGTNPRVYYLNLPKKFVAGTIYDPEKEEVLIGSTCTLTSKAGTKTYKVETDYFGDFWFKNVEVDTYSLKIEAVGKIKIIDSVTTEEDVNLGDIPIS
jgi:tetrathionate reductase subunit B